MIIAVCFIAAIVVLIIGLIIWASVKKKKRAKKNKIAAINANNTNTNVSNTIAMKNSARAQQVSPNKEIPMDNLNKEPILKLNLAKVTSGSDIYPANNNQAYEGSTSDISDLDSVEEDSDESGESEEQGSSDSNDEWSSEATPQPRVLSNSKQ